MAISLAVAFAALLMTVAFNRAASALEKMMTELEKLTQEVAATKTVMQSAVVFIGGIKDQLAAAGTDPVKLAALTADLTASTDGLAAAIATEPPAEA